LFFLVSLVVLFSLHLCFVFAIVSLVLFFTVCFSSLALF
jgi:hypothetical protein